MKSQRRQDRGEISITRVGDQGYVLDHHWAPAVMVPVSAPKPVVPVPVVTEDNVSVFISLV